MPEFVTYFDPPPAAAELPARLPSPFAAGPPHPLARRAAADLQAALRAGDPRPPGFFEGTHRGKMFAVLVVADAGGRVGWLRGFSGMIDRDWQVDGFVGPLFDLADRDSFWPAGEAELGGYDRQLRQLEAAGEGAGTDALRERRREIRARQSQRSNELLARLFAGYDVPSARGERRPITALFAPAVPPGGAGDCAAPKLFAHAQGAGLRPLALAEFWWGTPPAAGGRLPGVFYPSCRGKCGPVLAHMLNGWDVDPPPRFGGRPLPASEPRTVFEDRWLVVVNKPAGLLSVPGRDPALADSVLSRLRARYPEASGPLLVHRLDLDTSGLLLAARDADTHAALQRQFLDRQVDKRYVAWLEGSVAADGGRVQLPLRVDLDDRPRQIHDPVHGKPAVTDWRVIARTGGRTRVALVPHTGRTHQLRVHAAHPTGIGVPIVGDRLYGRPDRRLMLHAEALGFVHPHTGDRMTIEQRAPF
jgi:tRNA pseudouridine32 synthase/23S rRNA pseudouridine746 synthase